MLLSRRLVSVFDFAFTRNSMRDAVAPWHFSASLTQVLPTLILPSVSYRVAVGHPVKVTVGLAPILFQLSFQLVIPLGKAIAVLGTGAVAESVGFFCDFIARTAANGLFERVTRTLMDIGLLSTEVVF